MTARLYVIFQENTGINETDLNTISTLAKDLFEEKDTTIKCNHNVVTCQGQTKSIIDFDKIEQVLDTIKTIEQWNVEIIMF